MDLKKRAIEGIMVAGSLVILSTIADTANTVAAMPAVAAVETRTDLATNGTAGFVVHFDRVETNALGDIITAAAVIEKSEAPVVASAEEKMTEEELAWQKRLMADVNEFLYVREAGDDNAGIVGKLYKGDVADIVEQGDTWTHIVSGNVDGFVKNEFCVWGTDAMNYAVSNVDTEAEIKTNGLRVRSSADEDASVITAVSTGTTLTVDTSVEAPEDWIPVKYGEDTAYVSAEYVTTELALGEGVTVEEEQAAIARAAKEAAAAKAAQVTETVTVQNQAVQASVDDVTLLAAIIQCEAGSEPYEGQLAVGAVVMNRVRSGGYPGSIYEVIYQRGQFTPAGSGSVASVAARGPKGSCIQAAQEALGGADNTGGATSFRRASSGRAGLVIGNHVFF